MTSRQSGFTLVEIGVIVPVLMIIAITLFSTIFNYLLSSSQEQARLSQSFSQSTALDRIEADIKLSAAFLATDDSNMSTDPYELYSSGTTTWNYAGNSGVRALILREYATTGNPLASSRSPVLLKATGAPDCSQVAYISGPLTYNIIYFVKGNVLYKRILNDRSSATCTTQYQKLSCPSLATLGSGTRDAACGANDEVVANYVSGFSVDYYADQNAPTKLDAYTDSSLLMTAGSIAITIQNTQKAYNGNVTTSSSIRVLSQNQPTGGS